MKVLHHRKHKDGYRLAIQTDEGDEASVREFYWVLAPEGWDEKEYEQMQIREAKLLIEAEAEDEGQMLAKDVKL